jgi:CheY-like chemotaxis protein
VSHPREILILNDEDERLLLLRHALQRAFPGVVVLEFLDAEAALEALRAHSVDAIITDNRMPTVSGIEFVRRFRTQDTTTPVLMLTGSHEKKNEAEAAGVNTFIANSSWPEIREQIRMTLAAMATKPPESDKPSNVAE